MKEVISAIRNEVITLNELAASLNSDQWQSPTKFKDWSPELIISHLYYFDLMTIYSHNNHEKFDEEAKIHMEAMNKCSKILYSKFKNEILVK